MARLPNATRYKETRHVHGNLQTYPGEIKQARVASHTALENYSGGLGSVGTDSDGAATWP